MLEVTKSNLSLSTTKPTELPVRLAKTQIRLGICPSWSVSLLCAQWVAKGPSFLHADSKTLSLRWAHMLFCWFCHAVAHLLTCLWWSSAIVMKRAWNELYYRKVPKYSDTQNICCDNSKIWTMWLYHGVMSPNDADGMANSVGPDQTAPRGAVWSGSARFA